MYVGMASGWGMFMDWMLGRAHDGMDVNPSLVDLFIRRNMTINNNTMMRMLQPDAFFIYY
jgi:hypothetical protein